MKLTKSSTDRRGFLKSTAVLTSGISGVVLLSQVTAATDPGINIIGPKEGYSPQIGTLVSMMNWMRMVLFSSVQGMTQADLDYLHDNKANTIGALLLHLAATDTFYHLHTFKGEPWGSWDDKIKQKWDVPMELGEPARKAIKGNNLDYYLNILKETREKTLLELRKRDDNWLLSIDKKWPWGPTNNYCKWFHVCEHESNHNGQIKFIKGRLPGAKTENG